MKNLCFLVVLFFFGIQTSVAQVAVSSQSSIFTEDEIAGFKKQATQLVGFMEYAFNTLGNPKTEYRDKDVIINQSFLKFFRDAKVQVEDDLIEKRDVVTNKDIQAYLKDIDFFFKEVTFKYTVEEITQEINEKGETYFRVKASRNIKGTTVEGNPINENRPRFIEINLNESSRDLKIVSIYTTRTSEEQEIYAWWRSLTPEWRVFFSGETVLHGQILMADVEGIGRDFLLNVNEEKSNDTVVIYDTLKLDPAPIMSEIRKIWRAEQLDISQLKGIADIDPLSVFTSLKYLNISGARITDLNPIRNLSKLETLIASSSLISSIDAIQYTSSIRHLDLSASFVRDISPLSNFRNLETLNLSDAAISNPEVLTLLASLRELKLARVPLSSASVVSGLEKVEFLDLSGVPLSDFSGLTDLPALTRINLSKTYIQDVSPLATLRSLKYIYLDYTPVAQLDALKSLPDLTAIYCDKTQVGKSQALAFTQARPEVKVIYESEELSAWWESIPVSWKQVFSGLVEVSQPPLREQLYEISTIRSINISGNAAIQTLSPLRKLPTLNYLNASGSSVSSVLEIKELQELRELDISSTKVVDLTPLSGLQGLEKLSISNTQVSEIGVLSRLRNLRDLEMDNVAVSSAKPILSLSRLEKLYADGVQALLLIEEQLWDSLPAAHLVYQTPALQLWWENLQPAWKNVFSELEPVNGNPDRDQLHRITALKTMDISRNREISSLAPVSQLKRLETINISNTGIDNLLPLGQIKRIRSLDCSNTPVSDLSPLITNSNLAVLICSNTPVNNLDPVKFMGNLQTLDISGTQVTRLNPLTTLNSLENLVLFNTRISSLKPLEGLMSLKSLKAYNTRISEKNINKFRASKPGVDVVYY